MEPVTWGAVGAAILGLIAALPKLIGYAERLVKAIERFAEAQWESAQAAKCQAGIEYARITKDTSKLEDLFNPKPSPKSPAPGGNVPSGTPEVGGKDLGGGQPNGEHPTGAGQ